MKTIAVLLLVLFLPIQFASANPDFADAHRQVIGEDIQRLHEANKKLHSIITSQNITNGKQISAETLFKIHEVGLQVQAINSELDGRSQYLNENLEKAMNDQRSYSNRTIGNIQNVVNRYGVDIIKNTGPVAKINSVTELESQLNDAKLAKEAQDRQRLEDEKKAAEEKIRREKQIADEAEKRKALAEQAAADREARAERLSNEQAQKQAALTSLNEKILVAHRATTQLINDINNIDYQNDYLKYKSELLEKRAELGKSLQTLETLATQYNDHPFVSRQNKQSNKVMVTAFKDEVANIDRRLQGAEKIAVDESNKRAQEEADKKQREVKKQERDTRQANENRQRIERRNAIAAEHRVITDKINELNKKASSLHSQITKSGISGNKTLTPTELKAVGNQLKLIISQLEPLYTQFDQHPGTQPNRVGEGKLYLDAYKEVVRQTSTQESKPAQPKESKAERRNRAYRNSIDNFRNSLSEFKTLVNEINNTPNMSDLERLNQQVEAYNKGQEVIRNYNNAMNFESRMIDSDRESVQKARADFEKFLRGQPELKDLRDPDDLRDPSDQKMQANKKTAEKFFEDQLKRANEAYGSEKNRRKALESSLENLQKFKTEYLQAKGNSAKKSSLFDRIFILGQQASHAYNAMVKAGDFGTSGHNSEKAKKAYNDILNIKHATGVDFIEDTRSGVARRFISIRQGTPLKYKRHLFDSSNPNIRNSVENENFSSDDLRSRQQNRLERERGKINWDETLAKNSYKQTFKDLWRSLVDKFKGKDSTPDKSSTEKGRLDQGNSNTATETIDPNDQKKTGQNAKAKAPYSAADDPWLSNNDSSDRYEKFRNNPAVDKEFPPGTRRGHFGQVIKSFALFYGGYALGDLTATLFSAQYIQDNPLAWQQMYERFTDPRTHMLLGPMTAGHIIYKNKQNKKALQTPVEPIDTDKPLSSTQRHQALKLLSGVAGATYFVHFFLDLISDITSGDIHTCYTTDNDEIRKRACNIAYERWNSKDKFMSYTPYALSMTLSTAVTVGTYKAAANKTAQFFDLKKKSGLDAAKKAIKLAGKTSIVKFIGSIMIIMAIDNAINPVIQNLWNPLNFNYFGLSIDEYVKQNRSMYSSHVESYSEHLEKLSSVDKQINSEQDYDYTVLANDCEKQLSKLPPKGSDAYNRIKRRMDKAYDSCEYDKNPHLMIEDDIVYNNQRKRLLLDPFFHKLANWQEFTTQFTEVYLTAESVYKYFIFLKANEDKFSREEIEQRLSLEALHNLTDDSKGQPLLADIDKYPKSVQQIKFKHIVDYLVFQMACGANLTKRIPSDPEDENSPLIEVINDFSRKESGGAISFIPPSIIASPGKSHMCSLVTDDKISGRQNYREDMERLGIKYNDVLNGYWHDERKREHNNLAIYVFDNMISGVYSYNDDEAQTADEESVTTAETQDNEDLDSSDVDTSETQVSDDTETNTEMNEETLSAEDIAKASNEKFIEDFSSFKFSWWSDFLLPQVEHIWDDYESDYIDFVRSRFIKPLVGTKAFYEFNPSMERSLMDRLSLSNFSRTLHGNDDGIMKETYKRAFDYFKRIQTFQQRLGFTTEFTPILVPMLKTILSYTNDRRKYVARWEHIGNSFYAKNVDHEQKLNFLKAQYNMALDLLKSKQRFYSKNILESIIMGKCTQNEINAFIEDSNGSLPSEKFSYMIESGDEIEVPVLVCGDSNSIEYAKTEIVKVTNHLILKSLLNAFHLTYISYLNELAPYLQAIWY